jgi:hypothetical protein
MPAGQLLCPRCHDDLFVRAEQIISGGRVMRAYYCGRCNHEWQVESAPKADERRRQGERRRKDRLDELIKNPSRPHYDRSEMDELVSLLWALAGSDG